MSFCGERVKCVAKKERGICFVKSGRERFVHIIEFVHNETLKPVLKNVNERKQTKVHTWPKWALS